MCLDSEFIPHCAPKTVILTQVRTQSRRRGFTKPGNSLRRNLGPGVRRDDGKWSGCLKKTYPPPFPPSDNALGFRDGRHGPCHLCPETCGACPRVGDDVPMLRQGVRSGPGALNDRPSVPGALESGARASGKSPRTGCRRCHVFQIKPVDGIGRHPLPLPYFGAKACEAEMPCAFPWETRDR